MEYQRTSTSIIAPLSLATVLGASLLPLAVRADQAPGPFALDPDELDPIRYTRLPEESADELPFADDAHTRRTEVSFSLAPGRPDFSREGAYGLGMLFGNPEIVLESAPPGLLAAGNVSTLNEGLRYSAGVRIEHEDADINGTAYVSSSLLGLSYGRLGRLWYGGIDVNLEQFDNERYGEDQPDVLSLDVTTGRRLGITGLGTDAPLWLLSLRGDFDLIDADADADAFGKEPEAAWYLNPSLFWEHPGFTFSAQVQVPVPVDSDLSSTDEEEPDYRLRAVFQKRFK